jgi:hypothetical protein
MLSATRANRSRWHEAQSVEKHLFLNILPTIERQSGKAFMQRSFFALLTLCSVPQEPIGLDIVTSKTWENKNSKHTSNSLALGRQRFHAPLRVCLVPALY